MWECEYGSEKGPNEDVGQQRVRHLVIIQVPGKFPATKMCSGMAELSRISPLCCAIAGMGVGEEELQVSTSTSPPTECPSS